MANNSVPEGHNLGKRDLALHVKGSTLAIKGLSSSTTVIGASGVQATDIIVGVVNLSDPSEAQVANSSFTPTADTVTCSAASLTNAKYYLVLVFRPATS